MHIREHSCDKILKCKAHLKGTLRAEIPIVSNTKMYFFKTGPRPIFSTIDRYLPFLFSMTQLSNEPRSNSLAGVSDGMLYSPVATSQHQSISKPTRTAISVPGACRHCRCRQPEQRPSSRVVGYLTPSFHLIAATFHSIRC